MTKFTYDEFKKKIRESLRPKPAPLVAPKSRTLLETLHNQKPLRKFITLKPPEIR
jgi:hypothetical protein